MKEDFPLNIYKTLDLNKDGNITFGEFNKKKSRKFLKTFMASRSSSKKINMKKEFKKLDKNKDKVIEPKEIDISLDGLVIFPKRNNSNLDKNEQIAKKQVKKTRLSKKGKASKKYR